MRSHATRFQGLFVQRFQDGRVPFDAKLPHGYKIEVVPGKPPYADMAPDEVVVSGDGLEQYRARLSQAKTLTGLLERDDFAELGRELTDKALTILESLGLKPDVEPARIKTGRPDFTHWGTVGEGMRVRVFFPRKEPVTDRLSLASIAIDVDPTANLEFNAAARMMDWLIEKGFLSGE